MEQETALFSNYLNKKKQQTWSVIDGCLDEFKQTDTEVLHQMGQQGYNTLLAQHWDIVRDYPHRQGKYLRPGLVLLMAESLGVETEKALYTAAAMQTSEDWILIHDDLVDGSLERRGKAALHRIYGPEIAVNAGDTLHECMHRILNKNYQTLDTPLANRVSAEFFRMLSRTTFGQYAEIKWTLEDRQDMSQEDVLFTIGGKTVYYTIAGPLRLGAILAGALGEERLPIERTLGLEITANPKGLAVLHYDTEQSEAQLHKNLGKTLRRASLTAVPDFYHSLYLASLSRKDRLKLIRESMDLFHHRHGGIHLVVIDGIADLIRSANDETESIAIVDELYRLSGIYNTCIICVLHFVPNGIKLRGHIGSELQRKAAGILSIEKDDNPEFSVVKALKVRDGSPLDVPMMLFGWDKAEDMHVYRGEKSKEDKEKRKTDELIGVVKEAFRSSFKLSYQELCEVLMREMEIKDRTAKKYIAYMKEQRILAQDTNGNYQKGELCRT